MTSSAHAVPVAPWPPRELVEALGQAHQYLTMRSLTSGDALRLSAKLRLALDRAGDLVAVGGEVLDYLAARTRPPLALIATLSEALEAERARARLNPAAARRVTCGGCDAVWRLSDVAHLGACPACGAPSRKGTETL